MTGAEIAAFTEELYTLAQSRGIDAAFLRAEELLHRWPGCDRLTISLAMTLNGLFFTLGVAEPEPYERRLEPLYRALADSEEPDIRDQALHLLIGRHMRREEYAAAEELLSALSDRWPHRDALQAGLLRRTGRGEEAAELWERRLLNAATEVYESLVSLQELALQAERLEDGARLAALIEETVERYALIPGVASSGRLQQAAAEGDKTAALSALRDMLEALNRSWDGGGLYPHLLPGTQVAVGSVLLPGLLSEAELAHVHTLVEQLLPLRQTREAEARWQLSTEEANLVDRLNRLYERYTLKYLGGGGSWGYASPAERPLADYAVEPDGGLRLTSGEDVYRSLWAQVNALLPEGALDGFSRFTVFTDGLDETLAYVSPLDDTGTRWELAVDPADAGELDWFTETVLHEYTHYLTLNDTQADYGAPESGARYCEEGMVARSGSYLDDFYHAFWTDYLHDRLANPDSYGFYLRHQADFVTDYASTDPSEDIAESFTYFVLWDAPEGDAVWEEKLNFFYRYPELVEFRTQARARLGL